MMDPIVLYPSAGLGFVLIVVYLFRCFRKKHSPSLPVIIGAVLSASVIVCGVLLIAGGLDKRVMDRVKDVNLYIVVAGLALCYVSITSIYKEIFSGWGKDGDGN